MTANTYGPSINGRITLTQGAQNHYAAVLETMLVAVDGVSVDGLKLMAGQTLMGSIRVDNETFLIFLDPRRNSVEISTPTIRGSKRLKSAVMRIEAAVAPLMTPYSTVKAA